MNFTPTLGSCPRFDKNNKHNTLLSAFGMSQLSTSIVSSNKEIHSQTQSSKKIQSDYLILDSFISSKKKAFDFAPIFETSRKSLLKENNPVGSAESNKNTISKPKEPKRRKSNLKPKTNNYIHLESDNDSDSCYNEDNLSEGFNSCREDYY
jgi:hypothetical protein